MLTQVQSPFDYFVDLAGDLLASGSLEIGVAGQDPTLHPQAVYWDAAMTSPASQPLSVVGGYVVNAGAPARVYTEATYSMRLRDGLGAVLFDELQASRTVEASQVNYVASGTGAVQRTAQSKIRDVWNVLDFIPVSLHAAIKARTVSTDLGPYLQAAHDALKAAGGGVLDFGAGLFTTATMLTVDPTYVSIRGGGKGVIVLGVPAVTELRWIGAANAEAVLRIGYQGKMAGGGFVEDILVNANSLANRAVAYCDFWHCYATRLGVKGALVANLYLTNTTSGASVPFPSGFSTFEDVEIVTKGYGTKSDTSIGLHVEGVVGSGAGAVTVMAFLQLQVWYDTGVAIQLGAFNDNFHWHRLGVGSSATTPISLAVSPSAVTGAGGHYFSGVTSLQNILIPVAGSCPSWVMDCWNDTDPGGSLVGAGTDDVSVLSSYSGRKYGPAMTFGIMEAPWVERCRFRRYDAAGLELLTIDHAWKTGGVGTPSFAAAGQNGGAITVSTSAALGDATWFGDFYGSMQNDGLLLVSARPRASLTAASVSTEGYCLRWGYFGDLNDPFTDGCWFELDPSASGFIRATTARAGVVSPYLVSTLGVGPLAQMTMSITGNGAGGGFANFRARPNGQSLFNSLGSITTNIPTVGLSFGVYLKARSAGAKSVLIYDIQGTARTAGF